jgi:predicted lipid carrier protein YhbT
MFSRGVSYAKGREMRSPRGPVRRVLLTSVFRAIPARMDRERAKDVNAVVEWRILNGRGVVDTIWTTEIAGGRCHVRRRPAADPRTTIELSTGDFLLLVAGEANAPSMLFSGRIKLRGDMMFAAGLPSLFGPAEGRAGEQPASRAR